MAWSLWKRSHHPFARQLSPLDVPNATDCQHKSHLSACQESWELKNMSGLDKETKSCDPSELCPFADSRWQTDKWLVSAQVYRSLEVASMYKWQVLDLRVVETRRKK
jgi:hypothetical protein